MFGSDCIYVTSKLIMMMSDDECSYVITFSINDKCFIGIAAETPLSFFFAISYFFPIPHGFGFGHRCPVSNLTKVINYMKVVFL